MAESKVLALLQALDERIKAIDKAHAESQARSKAKKQRFPVEDTKDALPLLTQLKETTRDARISRPLYTEEGIAMLMFFAFPQDIDADLACVYEAQKCLANALLQCDECVAILLNAKSTGLKRVLLYLWLTQTPKESESDFLTSRILFLIITKTGEPINSYLSKEDTDLFGVCLILMCKRLIVYAKNGKASLPALIEMLKLLYTLSVYCQDIFCQVDSIEHHVFEVLLDGVEKGESLQIQHTVNLLTNMRLTEKQFARFHPKVTDCLIDRLDHYLQTMKQNLATDEKQVNDELIAPLVAVLTKLATVGHAPTRELLRKRLLVQPEERTVPLGRGKSLASRLLHQTTSSGSLCARECISALLYELSDNDPKQFVYNVGYGHASGFLTAHGLAIPPLEESEINPVTGQFVADEQQDFADLSAMTDEEKEREAERLFVLFQRLKKTGVVDVQDPIQQAVDSGRFQQL